ncbi:hypothetical protein Hanom_Chr10g00910941 [Helianthus anomalus]
MHRLCGLLSKFSSLQSRQWLCVALMRDQITNLKTPMIKQQTITQLNHTTTTISIHTKKVYMICGTQG